MSTLTGSTRALQAHVEAILASRLQPSYTASHEHIAASVNDQGEVWLSGLVNDARIAEEAVSIVQKIPGINRVFNYVTVIYSGRSRTL